MSETDQPSLATLRKRRGVSKASVTRLNTRLKDLESRIHEPTTSSLAQRMSQMLETLDTDFKKHHYAVIDHIDEADVEAFGREQDALDQHDDSISNLAIRIEQVIATCSLTSGLGAGKIASRRLSYLKNNLSAVSTAVHALTAESAELYLLHQYQEQLSDFKKELGDVRQTLLSLGVEEGDELETSTNAINKVLFDCSLQLKEVVIHSLKSNLWSINGIICYNGNGSQITKNRCSHLWRQHPQLANVLGAIQHCHSWTFKSFRHWEAGVSPSLTQRWCSKEGYWGPVLIWRPICRGNHVFEVPLWSSQAHPPDSCALCKNEKHPLYVCTRFKSLPRDKMMSTIIKSNELCLNCLRPGHFSKQCPSLNRIIDSIAPGTIYSPRGYTIYGRI